MELITMEDKQYLERLEGVIDKNLKAFHEVGLALMQIRDSKLYRATHQTFEEYCKERWDISRPRAYQFIESAQVQTNLSTIVDILPESESQTRPLIKLGAELQREAWQRAIETAPEGKVTAAHVCKIVKEMTHEVEKPQKEPQKIEITEAIGISTFIICHLERIRKDDPKIVSDPGGKGNSGRMG